MAGKERAAGRAGSGTSCAVLQTARPIWLERHVSFFRRGTSIQTVPGLSPELPHRTALTQRGHWVLPDDAAASCSSSTVSSTTHGSILTPLPLCRRPTSSTVPAERSAPLQARLWLQDQDLASPAPCTTIKPWLIRSGKLGQAVYQAWQPASGSGLSISSVPTLAGCSLALSHGCSSFNIPTRPWPQPSCPQTDRVRAMLNQSRSPHASSFELSSLHGGP